jgi:D-sedoheptulose 7-phosphate isomerase
MPSRRDGLRRRSGLRTIRDMSTFSASAALDDVCTRVPALAALARELYAALDLLETCARDGHKVLLCGNGGSSADADHIAGELMKSFCYRRPIDDAFRRELMAQFPAAGAELAGALERTIPAIALAGQVASMTAFSNDVDYRYAFAQQVYGLGMAGDVLIGISTSGNSANVVHACRVARVRGLRVIGLTGASGGQMVELCDVALRAPARETHLVQELHLPIYHALCLGLEERLFGQFGKR